MRLFPFYLKEKLQTSLFKPRKLQYLLSIKSIKLLNKSTLTRVTLTKMVNESSDNYGLSR